MKQFVKKTLAVLVSAMLLSPVAFAEDTTGMSGMSGMGGMSGMSGMGGTAGSWTPPAQ